MDYLDDHPRSDGVRVGVVRSNRRKWRVQMRASWKKTPAAGLIIGILSLAGCTGQLYTVIGGKNKEGVPVYPPSVWVEQYETTILISEGKVRARATGEGPKCVPIPSSKIAIRPDYTKPYFMKYSHGILEKYELEVELTESGTLQKVKTISGPDRGETFKNLAAAAKDAASIAAGAPVADNAVAGGQLACNSGEVFKDARPFCMEGCPPPPDPPDPAAQASGGSRK
jgi:hypothetical protein